MFACKAGMGFQHTSTKWLTNRPEPKNDHRCRPMQRAKDSVLLLDIPSLSLTNNHDALPKFGRRYTGVPRQRAGDALSSIRVCLHKSKCSLEQNKKRPSQKHTCSCGTCGCCRTTNRRTETWSCCESVLIPLCADGTADRSAADM